MLSGLVTCFTGFDEHCIFIGSAFEYLSHTSYLSVESTQEVPCWFARCSSSAGMGTENVAHVRTAIKPDPPLTYVLRSLRTGPMLFVRAPHAAGFSGWHACT